MNNWKVCSSHPYNINKVEEVASRLYACARGVVIKSAFVRHFGIFMLKTMQESLSSGPISAAALLT